MEYIVNLWDERPFHRLKAEKNILREFVSKAAGPTTRSSEGPVSGKWDIHHWKREVFFLVDDASDYRIYTSGDAYQKPDGRTEPRR